MQQWAAMLVATSVATILMMMLVVEAAPSAECIKDSHACVHGNECCSGCCVEEKCVKFADSCNAAQSPCAVYSCPQGKTCYLQQVQCVQAPCPPVPACKDQDYEDYD